MWKIKFTITTTWHKVASLIPQDSVSSLSRLFLSGWTSPFEKIPPHLPAPTHTSHFLFKTTKRNNYTDTVSSKRQTWCLRYQSAYVIYVENSDNTTGKWLSLTASSCLHSKNCTHTFTTLARSSSRCWPLHRHKVSL